MLKNEFCTYRKRHASRTLGWPWKIIIVHHLSFLQEAFSVNGSRGAWELTRPFSIARWWRPLWEPHLSRSVFLSAFRAIRHQPSKSPFENHIMCMKSTERIHYPFLFSRGKSVCLQDTGTASLNLRDAAQPASSAALPWQPCHSSCWFQGGGEPSGQGRQPSLGKGTGHVCALHARRCEGKLSKVFSLAP